MGRLANIPVISYNFNVDVEIITPTYILPSTISTSTPSPIYARVKNIGASTLTVQAQQIIFLGGQPAAGSPQTLTTISSNQIKYFIVNARYLPSSFVSWTNSDIIIKQGGKISMNRQNTGSGKINLNKYSI